jgi:hypothetical protein
VPQVDQVNKPRTQQVILFRKARAMLHGRPENAELPLKSYETLHPVPRKTATIHRKIMGLGAVQGEFMMRRARPGRPNRGAFAATLINLNHRRG